MSEESLKQVAAAISAKRVSLTVEEARELAKRALKFKQERGRSPSITSPDAWEKLNYLVTRNGNRCADLQRPA
jgi:hypothetical protein